MPDTTNTANALSLLRLADLVTPAAIRVAAELRLADHLKDGGRTAVELAERTGAHPRPLTKILDHLVAIGVLAELPPGTFLLADLGRPLLSEFDHMGVRPFLDSGHVLGRAELAIMNLAHTVRTGGIAYVGTHGANLWADLDGTPRPVSGMEVFANTSAGFDADLVVSGYDWSRVRRVVDVGGNSGTLLIELLTVHSHLHGTLLDLPCFAELAEKNIIRAGLVDRCPVVAGDFFDRLPAGADVYLVSAVLADWDDEQAVRLLRRCAEAAGEQGRVLLAEVHMTAAHPDPVERTSVALRIEASIANPDRSVAELVALAEAAGLAVSWQGRHSAVRSLVELRPSAAAVGGTA